jgi:hypothetical protein
MNTHTASRFTLNETEEPAANNQNTKAVTLSNMAYYLWNLNAGMKESGDAEGNGQQLERVTPKGCISFPSPIGTITLSMANPQSARIAGAIIRDDMLIDDAFKLLASGFSKYNYDLISTIFPGGYTVSHTFQSVGITEPTTDLIRNLIVKDPNDNERFCDIVIEINL